ncbi:MAG: GEVED domain-containing protein [Planctomycetes bacterium]|jgi:hypothetical protein|nr:GEVED domain-containing protein [Planctomycetota bacterium]
MNVPRVRRFCLAVWLTVLTILPDDARTANEESAYPLSRGSYQTASQLLKPATTDFPFAVGFYNPAWIAVDVLGQSATVYGAFLHDPGIGETSEQDLGDAPDTYRTLPASNGPRHTVVEGLHLGRLVDAEPDARGDSTAAGDDLRGQSDEDGVAFTSPLSPGLPATIEVVASAPGYLNAWLDFDRDGTFGAAGEQVCTDQLLAPGVNKLSFPVPATAVKGVSFARFRFNTRGLLSFYGAAADGEVEDYQVTIAARLAPQVNAGKGGLAWSQTPQQFDAATPFILNGWGEPSGLHLRQIVADDWRCEDNRPITGFQWYGSFEGWTQPTLPLEQPLAFHVAIWTDSTPAPTGTAMTFHHPDTLVWEALCTSWAWSIAGYHSDPGRISDDTCFQLTWLLSQDQWFYPASVAGADTNVPTVYWLSIAALYDPNKPAPRYPWGWTTRPLFFNHGAVAIQAIEPVDGQSVSWPPSLASRYRSGAAVELPQATTWDVAFELLTNQAVAARDPDVAPVYRFWSPTLRDHFYTISETEKDRLLKECPNTWSFEGIAFYAYPPEQAPVGSKPVYRFWSESLGHHHYAASEAEKQSLLEQQPNVWTPEGIAWYAFD